MFDLINSRLFIRKVLLSIRPDLSRIFIIKCFLRFFFTKGNYIINIFFEDFLYISGFPKYPYTLFNKDYLCDNTLIVFNYFNYGLVFRNFYYSDALISKSLLVSSLSFFVDIFFHVFFHINGGDHLNSRDYSNMFLSYNAYLCSFL